MARILVVAGGCRGRALAASLAAEGHALRITTRSEASRAAIEAAGAECWIGSPGRLATLRGALENVTIACWLLGTATGPPAELEELHSSRLQFFITQMIDTTVRGFVYEAGGASAPAHRALVQGEALVARLCAQNAIPSAVLRGEPSDPGAWLVQARRAIEALLMRR